MILMNGGRGENWCNAYGNIKLCELRKEYYK